MPVKILRSMLIAVVLFTVLILLAVFVLQRQLIYFPRSLEPESARRYAAAQGLEPFVTAAGEKTGWQTPRTASTRARLVVFHGNGSLALFSGNFLEIAPVGWQVILPEYPGYGTRPGSPTERSIQDTAAAVMETLTSDPLPVVVAGQSLGSAVACWTAGAFSENVTGLLLISPFPRLADVAGRHYPWLPARLLLRDRFEAEKSLAHYAGPIVFVVAGSDTIVPAALGRALHDNYRGPKLLLDQPDADHNTLEFSPAWWRPAFDFLQSTISPP